MSNKEMLQSLLEYNLYWLEKLCESKQPINQIDEQVGKIIGIISAMYHIDFITPEEHTDLLKKAYTIVLGA